MKNKLVLFLILFLTLVSEIKAQTDKDKKSRSVGCLNVSSVAIDISIFCAGKSQLLTAVPTNGGQTPFYNWTLNNVSIPVFSNTTTDDGLGSNTINDVYVTGNYIYATTSLGLSISNNSGVSFSNKTKTANGLGNDLVRGMFVGINKIYVATAGGLSISEDGGNTFINKTKLANGLGSNIVNDVVVDATGNYIYAATSSGLSISNDAGLTFNNIVMSNVRGVFVDGSSIYAATSTGLNISNNGGASFSLKTTTDGLGNNNVNDIFKVGSIIYAATSGGLSISTDGGLTFSNKTTANGLIDNNVSSAFAIGDFIYASTAGGLSMSNDAGYSFIINKTALDGFGTNTVNKTFALGNKIFAATTGGLAITNINTLQVNNAKASDVYTVTMFPSYVACSGSQPVTNSLTISPLPQPSITTNSPICKDVTLTLNGSNLRTPTSNTYQWKGPNDYLSTDKDLSFPNSLVEMSGSYKLIVTDISGCVDSTSNIITVRSLPNPLVGYNPNVCAETTIKLTSSDTRAPNIGPYTYSWTGSGFENTQQNPEIANATVGMSGVYNLTMKDVFLCSATASINVTVYSSPTLVAVYNDTVCAGTDLNLLVTDTRGTDDEQNPYTYSWSGNAFTALVETTTASNGLKEPNFPNATPSMSGKYNVTVGDQYGCTATTSVDVVVHSLPQPIITYNDTVCALNTLNLVGTDNREDDFSIYSYTWTGPENFSSSIQNPSRTLSTIEMTGTYHLSMRDTFGCVDSTSKENVIVHSLPTPTLSYNPNVCAETTIKLTSSDSRNPNIGPYTYSWTGNGFTSPNGLQNPEIANATVGMSGVYNLTMKDVFLCSATASINVTVYSSPTLVAVYNDTVCAGTDLNLLVTDTRGTDDEQNPYTYLWTGNAFSALVETATASNGLKEPNFPNANTGMSDKYNVTVTDQYGCTATTSVDVVVHSLPQPIITYNDTVCALNSLNLVVTDNREDDFSIYSYTWRGPENFSSSIQNPSRALSTIEMTGTYHLSMRDTFGCVDSTSKENIIVHSLPTPTVSYNPFLCAEKTIKFTSSDTRAPNIGPYTYSWTGNGFAIPNTQQNPEIANATVGMSGVYNLTMKDVFLCSATASINVSVYSLPIPVAVYNDTVCAGTDLNLLVTDIRDTGDEQTPYTYLWTGNAFSPGPTSLPISKNGLKNPIFQDANTGMSDKYNVTVTDQYGCAATTSVDVVVHSVPIPNAVYNEGPVCVGKILNLDVNDGRPTNDQHPNYEYRWSGPAFGSVPLSLPPFSNLKNPVFDPATKAMEGKYYVTVTDIVKCSASTSLDVLIHTLPVPSTSSNSPVCSAETLNLYASDTRAPLVNPYTYSWTGPNDYSSESQNPIFNSVSVSLTGVYSVTISDNFGCTTTSSTEVINHHPIATASNDGAYEEGENVNLLATGGTRFDWTGPNGFTSNLVNPTIPNGKVINAGIYSVTVTYEFCTATAITPVNIACSSPALSYYLAYSDMAVPEIITPISTNMLVQKSTRPMTVIAIPSCSSPTIEGIQLQLSGVGNNHFYVDNNAPFSLFETAGNLSGEVWVPTVYTFIARAFDQDNASGNVIIGPDNIQFRIINGNSTIIQPALSSNSVCAGSSITLTSDTTGAYEVGNIYQAYLSNKDGNFDDPVLIGSSADPKTINCIIPNYVSGGSNYKVMVRSSAPIVSTVSVATLNIAPAALILNSPNNNLVNSNRDQKAIYTIEARNKISGTSTINYKAQYNVTLKPGFEANNGTVFLAEIGDACNEDR